jgi:4-hydroxy-tetrahydrodipicolinate reductase
MTPAHFNDLALQGKIGHMGIGESVALIAAGLGHHAVADDVKITLEPVIAESALPSAVGEIRPGQVRGMRNTAKWADASLSIELDLTMAIGLSDPQDTVELTGPVPLRLTIPGSTPGDTATVAALVNCARLLPAAKPGLHTMLDLPVAGARG